MLLDSIYIIIGLALLYYGGDLLISGSLRIAQAFKISPFVIGATVMGFGTSAPELSVSLLAAFQGSPEISIGNVIGSNIANIGLVLGLTAFLVPLTIEQKILRRETPPLLIATFLILFLTWDNELGRWEGILLLAGVVLYTWRAFRVKDEPSSTLESEGGYFINKGIVYQFLLIVAGLILLVAGAKAMVEGGVNIARAFGISEWFIGISIIAVGTSLPEIISSLMSAFRGHGEMALGNVFGSNIFNILMVLGATATAKPLKVLEVIHPDLLFTTGLTCLLLVLIRLEHNLSKRDGVILLTAYVGYIASKATGIM
ncbi:MAG: calcium/sodium antiporter [Nitrospina sp.]|nr:MAG: calcium/sodium antiporter [Nitrospina sp.]